MAEPMEAAVVMRFGSSAANTSANGTADGADGSPASSLATMILTGIAFGLIIFMALFGNALVIASVIRIRRLRTITNYFVVSLAVADFLVAALVMPFSASLNILNKWIFANWVCYFFNSNDVLFCTASVLNLCMVAVDRYVAIVKPLRYHQVMTKRSAALMIASAWTASLAVSYVPIHLDWHIREGYSSSPGECDFKPTAIYSLTSSAISFWLPTLVILFVYGRIYHIAVGQAKEMRRLERHMANIYANIHQPSVQIAMKKTANAGVSKHASVPVSSGPSQQGRTSVVSNSSNMRKSASSGNHNHLRTASGTYGSDYTLTSQNRKGGTSSKSSESRATKVLAIVIGCYLLCWMPFFTWLNVMAICEGCPESAILGTILFWIGYSNSTLNPVIYAFFSRDFRNAFIASLRIDKWQVLRPVCFKLAKNRKGNEQMPLSRSPPKFNRALPDGQMAKVQRYSHRPSEVSNLPVPKEENESQNELPAKKATFTLSVNEQDSGNAAAAGLAEQPNSKSSRNESGKLFEPEELQIHQDENGNQQFSSLNDTAEQHNNKKSAENSPKESIPRNAYGNAQDVRPPSANSSIAEAKYQNSVDHSVSTGSIGETSLPLLDRRKNCPILSSDEEEDELSLRLLSIQENMQF